MRCNTSKRPGFTVRDLMVVVLIVGALLGLALTGLEKAREAGRNAHCQNNLRNLGISLCQFFTVKNQYPNAGTFFDDPAVHVGDPTKSNIYLSITDPGSFAGKPNPWLRSWAIDVMPYIDSNSFIDSWNYDVSYIDRSSLPGLSENNAHISSVSISLWKCPDDPTTGRNQGDLSYVVNGGFSRWHALPVGWNGGKADGQSQNGTMLHWVAPEEGWQKNQAVSKKLGVMFLGTHTGDQPWDIKTAPQDITDGMSNTFLLGENTLAGYSKGTPYSGGLPTNWACPLPNFTMFLGSDDVCHSNRSDGDCLGGQLRPPLGAGWARANQSGTFEDINYGQNLTIEGSFPFANSGHPGGANFVMCDGSTKFITSRIDGTVYAKLITPAGSRLPAEVRQTPLSTDTVP